MKNFLCICVLLMLILISCENRDNENIYMESNLSNVIGSSTTEESNEMREVKEYVRKYLEHNGLDTEEVSTDHSQFMKRKMPLLHSLPDDDIWLYGINDENFSQDFILLKVKNQYQIIPHHFFHPRAVMPQLSYRDFDGDSVKELVIIYYMGGGTGVSHYNLEVFLVNEEQKINSDIFCSFKSYYMDGDEMFGFISSKIKDTKCNQKDEYYIVNTTINNIPYSFDITKLINHYENDTIVFDSLSVSNVIHINIAEYTDYKIVAEFPIEINFVGWAIPEYTEEELCIYTEILWDGKKFSFGDIWVE